MALHYCSEFNSPDCESNVSYVLEYRVAVNEPYSIAVYFELETCIIQIFGLHDFGLSLTTHSLIEVIILMTRSAVTPLYGAL